MEVGRRVILSVNRASKKILLRPSSHTEMASTEEVKQIWKNADCVCFDVDSTVVMDEGIDELANFLGKGDEVSRITVGAMQGALSYAESLKARLDIIKPSHRHVSKFIETHPPRLTPGMKELIEKLQKQKKDIFLISGGFRCLIEVISDQLLIPRDKIFANALLFYYNGDFAGFDGSQPTCEGDGKAKVILHLKKTFGYKRLVHIGDGATDLEACPPADAFIGFGANQVREKVKSGSHWFVTSCHELIEALD